MHISCRWLPILPDGPLGDFVRDLGPGQVVGRQVDDIRSLMLSTVFVQVLAMPVMGEVQLAIAIKRGNLEVEVIRARNLISKNAAKNPPGSLISHSKRYNKHALIAPYVKVYLMENKICLAKAKTGTARRTTDPLFQQSLVFNEAPEGRMLQVR